MADLRRTRYHLLIWLAEANRRAPLIRRVLLVVLFVVTAILGLWGWFIYRNQHPAAGFDGWTIAYGMITLFTGNGEMQPVPMPLAVARLLAPFLAAGVALELLVTFGAARLRRAAARRAIGHTVLVGPHERTRAYVENAAGLPGTIVQVGSRSGLDDAGVLHLAADESDDWWAASNADHSRLLVLALGRDDLDLHALAAAFDRGLPTKGQRLVVEIDDASMGLRLSVALACDRPDAAIEVVCVDRARADHAASIVAAELGASHGRDAPGLVDGMADSTEPPSVAIIGDGVMSRQLVHPLAEHLRHLGRQSSAARPRLAIVDADPALQLSAREQALHQATLDLGFFDGIDAFLHAWDDAPVAAVVDLVDPLRSAKTAFELAWRRPGSTIWMARDEVIALPGADARTLSRAAAIRDGHLVGVFTRVAQLDHDDRAARGLPARAGGANTSSWDQIGDQARADATAAVRSAVWVLNRSGHPVVPLEDIGISGAEVFLGPDVRASLKQNGAAGADDPAMLLRALYKVGLAIPRRALHGVGAEHGGAPMPDDDAVEEIAKLIHENYLRDRAGKETPDHPALRPWDAADRADELSADLKGQNREQARDNILKLAAIGFRVVRSDTVGAGAVLTDEQLESLARAEHDRWAAQKMEQGYRFGPTRVDDGSDKRHPDLVSWEELSEDIREKDREPVRQMLDVFTAIGLEVRPVDDPDTPGP